MTYKNSSHLSSGQDMTRQLHLGEIPLPNGLEEAIVANMGMLLRRGERVATSRQAVATGGLRRGDRGLDKAVHRWMLQESQTSRDQQHPHSLTGTFNSCTHDIKLQKSLDPPHGLLLSVRWLHSYKQCSRVLQWGIVCAKAGVLAVQTEMNPLTQSQIQDRDPLCNMYVCESEHIWLYL